MVMTFGKYKGQDIGEVPSGYLEFLIQSSAKTARECRQELERRDGSATSSGESPVVWMARVVERGYRELARQYYGHEGVMRELDAAVGFLRESLRKLEG